MFPPPAPPYVHAVAASAGSGPAVVGVAAMAAAGVLMWFLRRLGWGMAGCGSAELPRSDMPMLLEMIQELEQACSTSSAVKYEFPARQAGQQVLPVGTYTLEHIRALHVPLLVYVAMHGVVDPLFSCLLYFHGLSLPPSLPLSLPPSLFLSCLVAWISSVTES